MRHRPERHTRLVRQTDEIMRQWRRIAVYVAIAAAFAGCSLLPGTTASASPLVCSPETHNVDFGVAGHNTQNFTKEADGCAQPWLSYISRSASIRVWVKWSGGWHNIDTTPCGEGFGTCNLANNWGSACNGNGTTCNGDEFHIQWGDPVEGVELKATLSF
jgi:hypothetical protein